MEIAIRQVREADLDVVPVWSCLRILMWSRRSTGSSFLTCSKRILICFSWLSLAERLWGHAQAEVRGDRADLNDIAVAEDNQRRGIGRQLLLTVLDAVKAKGAKILLAEVHHKCASAIPFYYAHGFRISGSVQDYFGVGHDAVIVKLVFQ